MLRIARIRERARSLAKIASWRDVEIKAKRLKDDGHVQMMRNGAQHVVARVLGDTDVYMVEIDRIDPDSRAITGWKCECEWFQHAFDRTRKWKKYEGRLCSHALATFWESQATPLDEEEEIQGPSPIDGVPPPDLSPEPMDVETSPVMEPIVDISEIGQSTITGPASEDDDGTPHIPGTFSKVMREALDRVIRR